MEFNFFFFFFPVIDESENNGKKLKFHSNVRTRLFSLFFPLRWYNKVVFRPATGIINRDQESILRAYVWSYLGKCLRKRRVEARRRKGQADSCRQRIVCPSGSYAHSSVHTRARTARTSLSVSIPCTRVTRLPAHSVSLWIRLVTYFLSTRLPLDLSSTRMTPLQPFQLPYCTLPR